MVLLMAFSTTVIKVFVIKVSELLALLSGSPPPLTLHPHQLFVRRYQGDMSLRRVVSEKSFSVDIPLGNETMTQFLVYLWIEDGRL